jgi:hypothetical protein
MDFTQHEATASYLKTLVRYGSSNETNMPREPILLELMIHSTQNGGYEGYLPSPERPQ